VTTGASGWQTSGWRRFQAAVIPWLVAPVMAALGRTWHMTRVGGERYDAVLAEGRQPIIACWHQGVLPGTLFWRRRRIVILASQNFDGEWITRTLGWFGYTAARGSSSRGGARALITLVRLMRQGHGVAITLDGPRGPARRAQPGALWLARQTGNPILPFHIEASRAWRLRSWDRSLVPRPGSRVVMVVAEPFEVPRDTPDDDIEQRRRDLERVLGELEVQAAGLVGRRVAAPDAVS
jgi:lysophospholipid acyltransferase (LPLAT)-like uncharacterized protein